MRVGIGYDAHRLIAQRPLVLGGVTIPHSMGLLGHSDADVLSHAIGDAILGALGLGDLGRHFPDTDPQFKGISSLVLLQRIMHMARDKGFELGNLDATVIAEKPKLADFIPEMVKNLARTLDAQPQAVNIKATTNEGLGWIGQEQGIAATAVVNMIKSKT